MGTYSAWESTATLHLLGGAGGAWAPTRGGEGRGHIDAPARLQLVSFVLSVLFRFGIFSNFESNFSLCLHFYVQSCKLSDRCFT